METTINLRGSSLISPEEDDPAKLPMPTIDLLLTSPETPDPPDSTATSGSNSTTTTTTTTTTNIQPPLPLSPSTCEPKPSPSSLSNPRSNQVRTVMLSGVPIVALVIDGKERLCLAQISNTLLKSFSYNEIHNRRVALGITCVQCTPVQLEILRRAGAMPISSRRCGMITKREAERLCKSFLTENIPPKLPDNFAFDVYHQCAWGCRGSFVPSRYNSSRAKCIKCNFCGLFFSPNKFIFHSHRLPESKYTQPDAASFNSWRRHLKLAGDPGEETTHAWEDVKAMFNGGSRRRVMMSHSSSGGCGRFHLVKRTRMMDEGAATTSRTTSEIDKSPPYLPVMPFASKTYPPPPPQQSPSSSPYLTRPATDSCIRQGFAEYMWGANKQLTPFTPPYHTFTSLPPPPPPNAKMADDIECTSEVGTRPHSSCSRESTVTSDQRTTSDTDDVTLYPPTRRSDNNKISPTAISAAMSAGISSVGYLSAFRPVIRAPNPATLLVRPLSTDPYAIPSTTITPSTEEGRVTSSTRAGRDSVASSTGGAVSSSSDGENVDIEMTTDDERVDHQFPRPPSPDPTHHPSHSTPSSSAGSVNSPPPSLLPMVQQSSKMAFVSMEDALNCNKQVSPVGLNLTSPGKILSDTCESQQAKLSCLSKEELEEILVHETQARRRAEKEFQLMKESFQEQVKREVAYREEMMAKQLHLVRGRDVGPRSVCITTPIDALPRIGAGEGSEIRRLAETQRSPRRSAPFLVQDVDFAAMYRMRLQAPTVNPIFPPPYQSLQQHHQPQNNNNNNSNKQCECCLTTANKPRDIFLTQNGIIHDHLRFHLFSNSSSSNDLFGASWTSL